MAENAKTTKRGSDHKRSEPHFLAIGQVTKAHGIQGEVSVAVLTDFPERFDEMETAYLGEEASVTPYTVETIRWHKDRVLLRFAGISDRTGAEKLRGLYLQIPIEEAMPLEPDAYYQHQLIGLTVMSDKDEVIGELVEILETGANDVYVVKGERGETLIPATKEVVLSVDLDSQQMIVHLLTGL